MTYTVDANGAMTSDGLRTFDYDASNRMTKVKVYKDGEAASIRYLHNQMGQRVFKGEPTAEQTLPDEMALGTSFIDWLKKNFSWLYAAAQANTSIGTAYVYGGDNEIPAWALLGEYDNGSSKGAGRTEYIWMPTEDGSATPIGLYRGGQFYALHTDHLGTPRLMTNEANKPAWQWPYSAFGSNKPTGILKATANPKAAITNRPVLLQATAAPEMNLGFPGQMRDVETGMVYNYFRHFDPKTGTYSQPDPIGMAGGLSRVVYANQNPLSFTDPMGLANSAATGWMRPAQSKSPAHDYEWKVFRCMGDCTEQTRQELLCNPAPSVYPNRPTRTGDVNMVSLGGQELGPILTAVSPTSNTTWNLTMPGHILHPGWVKREVVFDGSATWIVTTGGGDGFNPLNLNSILAPIVWGGQNPVKDSDNGCICFK